MQLDFSPLKKALLSLDKAIGRAKKEKADEELRDAVIQRFEYTFELCWKMLKRQLEQEVPTPAEVDHYSYRELLREAAERGLINDVQKWMVYRECRNLTSHSYDERKASQVFTEILNFYPDANSLLLTLEKRNCD